jgi:hypothetical protein
MREQGSSLHRSSAGYLAALLALLLLASACHEIAEFSSEGVHGVQIINTSDMTLVASMTGFDGARSICSVNDTRFLVACNTGQLFTVDSEELSVIRVQSIGLPFSTGYNSMTRANDGAIYIIGAYGRLLEYSTTSGAVLDEFSAGPYPIAVCRSPSRDSIYVADFSDGMLREVRTLGNTVTREIELPATPSSAAPFDEARDMVLVSSSEGQACYIDWDMLRVLDVSGASGSSDCAGLPDTAASCFVLPSYGSDFGMARFMYGDLPHFEEYASLTLSGDPLRVCNAWPEKVFYVASYLGDGTTRVYAIEGLSQDITGTLDVNGYPWDIVSHRSGEYVLVLTTGI